MHCFVRTLGAVMCASIVAGSPASAQDAKPAEPSATGETGHGEDPAGSDTRRHKTSDHAVRQDHRLHGHGCHHRPQEHQGRSHRAHVLRRVHAGRTGSRNPAADVRLQRRTRVVHDLAAHGIVRSRPRGRYRRAGDASAAIQSCPRIPTACSTRQTWSSSMRWAPDSRASSARASRRISTGPIRTSMRSRNSSSAISPVPSAGTPQSSCSANRTARHAARRS